MALAVEEDVPADPGDIGFFRASARVARPQSLANAGEEAGLARPSRAGLTESARGGGPATFGHCDVRDGRPCL